MLPIPRTELGFCRFEAPPLMEEKAIYDWYQHSQLRSKRRPKLNERRECVCVCVSQVGMTQYFYSVTVVLKVRSVLGVRHVSICGWTFLHSGQTKNEDGWFSKLLVGWTWVGYLGSVNYPIFKWIMDHVSDAIIGLKSAMLIWAHGPVRFS